MGNQQPFQQQVRQQTMQIQQTAELKAPTAEAPPAEAPATPFDTAAQTTQPLVAAGPIGSAAIAPVASGNNDASLRFDWQPHQIDSSRSCSCVVTTAADHSLAVRIEQPPYDRTLRGTGSVNVLAIPAAPIGTKGRVIAQDETSGATAEFTWEWQEVSKAQWANPSKQAAQAKVTRAAQAKATPAAATKAVSGPAATIKFCGLASQGWRLAFILDKSGSMKFGGGERWETSKRELMAALQSLPPDAEIFVVLYSDDLQEPTGQTGWMLARPEWITGILNWISVIQPNGGTFPKPAFERVFSMGGRPHTIFFLTDGEFSDITPEDIKGLRGSGGDSPKPESIWDRMARMVFPRRGDRKNEKKDWNEDEEPATIINTVTVGDSSGANACKKIADDSGGQYLHISPT
jgi:hypothetical protein